ncbi:E3 ubiquitin-protein ligase RING1-like [Phoenix dactylifera]|uniref:E3 ubiquitin-protein ligase RING1-like n=1 Tax=Phoenix dactylifera TaxID=42345 RepID=A0A8B9AW88_PHODC|nr:E3 ubiquitin-protein ligase RING1-like [Phoenix dactylifera]
MYVSDWLKGRGLEASTRFVAPVSIHLHVYEFCDGGLSLARPSESTNFSAYLRNLVDPRYLNNMVPEILSNTRYNDLDTQRFWQEKLNDESTKVNRNRTTLNVYIFGVSLDALLIGVEELEINVEIRIHEAFIKALEVVKYNDVGTKFQENGCSICLEEFEFEMEVTRMPCKHVFHGGCLTRWLERGYLCPLCRYEMPI